MNTETEVVLNNNDIVDALVDTSGIGIQDVPENNNIDIDVLEHQYCGVGVFGKESVAESPVPIIKFPAKLTSLKKIDYRNMLKSVREIYAREGLISNFVDLMKELNCGGMTVKAKAEFRSIFETFHVDVNTGMIDKESGIDALRRKFDHAMWTGGIFCVLFGTEARPVISADGKSSKKYVYPTEMTVLDPMLLDLDEIYTTGNIYYEPDKTYITAIKNWPGGPQKHPFVLLYPSGKRGPNDAPNIWKQQDIIELVQKSSVKIPLPISNIRLHRWINDDTEIYALPYLVRCFDAVNDKRLLRNQDRSLLTKMLNAILHIKVGTGTPGKSPSEATLERVRQGQENKINTDPSRMHVYVTHENQSYEWITIPPDTMLKEEHYKVHNCEILSALLGLVVNLMFSNTGMTDLTLVSKTIQGKNDLVTQQWKKFIEEIYNSVIISGNKLESVIPRGTVNVRMRRISTYETDAFKTFIANGVKMGVLPAKIFIDEINEDYDAIIEALISEQKLREDEQIFIGFPAYNQVFTQLTSTPSGVEKTVKQKITTPSPGKPPGQPQDNTNPPDVPVDTTTTPPTNNKK